MQALFCVLLASASVKAADAVVLAYYSSSDCNPYSVIGGGAIFSDLCTNDGHYGFAATLGSCGSGRATINVHRAAGNGGAWPPPCNTSLQYALPNVGSNCQTINLRDDRGVPFSLTVRLLETECEAPAPVFLVGWRKNVTLPAECTRSSLRTVLADGRCHYGGPGHSAFNEAWLGGQGRALFVQGYYRANASSDASHLLYDMNGSNDCTGSWYRLGPNGFPVNNQCSQVVMTEQGLYGTFTQTDVYTAIRVTKPDPPPPAPMPATTIAGIAVGCTVFVLCCCAACAGIRKYKHRCGRLCGKPAPKRRAPLTSTPAADATTSKTRTTGGKETEEEAVAVKEKEEEARDGSMATLNPVHHTSTTVPTSASAESVGQ